MNLKEFIEGYAMPLITNVAAAFTADGVLHYLVSDNPAVPAAVTFMEDARFNGCAVFTNLPSSHWIMTYLRPKTPQSAKLKLVRNQAKNYRNSGNTYLLGNGEYTDVFGENHEGRSADGRQLVIKAWPEFLKFRDVAAPLSGGLYAAAKAMSDRGGALPDPKARSSEEKVLQYYMLATFGLLGMCSEFAYKGLNNYVAAIIVGDDGKILAGGVNVGSYKHAEVSTLLSYFSKHGSDKNYPSKTIVFSTLCPCEQCIKYLEASRPSESVIYFSQMDTGESGKAGAEGGKSVELGKVTKPTRVAVTVPNVVDVHSSIVGLPARSVIEKLGVAEKLGTCIDSSKSNIAGQLGKIPEAVKTIKGSITALENKMAKERDGAGDQVKEKVLLHIAEWLLTAQI